MKPIVAFPFRHHGSLYCEEAKQQLRAAGFDLVTNDTGKQLPRDEQKALIRDAYAVVAGTEPYDADMLSCAENLKVIMRFGVGTDNFDLAAMKEKGIRVGVISNCNAVAEFALTLILDSLKAVPALDEAVRNTQWARYPMRELKGKTVGIVGFGRIGKRLAELLSGFGVTILASDPYMDEVAAKALKVTPVTLEELYAKSDIISLHAPAIPENYHMINEKTLAGMKKGAILVNTARGALVDEEAVKAALESGQLGYFASDVFAKEPVTKECCLLAEENTLLTPHTAALTFETNYNGGLISSESIIRVREGGDPVYPVL